VRGGRLLPIPLTPSLSPGGRGEKKTTRVETSKGYSHSIVLGGLLLTS
jgi:hypothetical protein